MGVKSIFDNPYWSNGKATGGNSYAGAIGSGIAAGAAIPAEEDRFSIDPNAGYKGSLSGLTQGGVVGAIAGGITSQVGTFSRVNRNLRGLDTGFQGYQLGPDGQPIYDTGAMGFQNQTLKELQEGQRKIKRSLDPATRIFSGIMGTGGKLRRAESSLRGAISGQQAEFNEANIQWQRQQLAKRAYEDQLMNVYGIPLGYY